MASAIPDKLLVAAIDFGTTYSGYAYCMKSDYLLVPPAIKSNVWVGSGAGLISHKAPTSVLFTPEKQFAAFGYEAEEQYAELAASEDVDVTQWYFFKRFKMMLHNSEGLNLNSTLNDKHNKPMLALDVFTAAINCLKDHLLQALTMRASEFLSTDIQWILTVPAIWGDAAKQFMRTAAKQAGISNDQLGIALEPEAASIYCQTLPTEKAVLSDGTALQVAKPGTRFLVLDLGGGTADITVHERGENGVLKEIHKASGGPWGGTVVDEDFTRLLIKIVGVEVWEQFQNECVEDYFILFQDFEVSKRDLKPDRTGKVSIRIPVALTGLLKKKPQALLKESDFADSLTWVADKLRIHVDLFKKLFQSAIENIISHLRSIFNLEEVENVDTIVMAGGFSESKIVQNAVKDAFPDKKFFIPEDAGLAVLKGAIMYGYNPTIVSHRVARWTYGLKVFAPFDPDKHSGKDKVAMNGREYCRDAFFKCISQGQTLELDEKCYSETYYPISDTSTAISLELFVTLEDNIASCNDPGCQLAGRLIVPMPDLTGGKERGVRVSFIFGGPEIKILAFETTTKKFFHLSVDFLE